MDLYNRKLKWAKEWLNSLTEDERSKYANIDERKLCDEFEKTHPRRIIDKKDLPNEKEFIRNLMDKNPDIKTFSIIRNEAHFVGDNYLYDWLMIEYYYKDVAQYDQ